MIAAFDSRDFKQRTHEYFRNSGGHDVSQPVLGVSVAALDLKTENMPGRALEGCLFEVRAATKRDGQDFGAIGLTARLKAADTFQA